jgi:hypothetical protein
LVWNIATTLALRLRLTNWHLHLATQKQEHKPDNTVIVRQENQNEAAKALAASQDKVS